jgi:hypothetical protein
MVRDPLKSIILCVLALIWIGERANLATALSRSAFDPCWSESVEKAERDKLHVDCLPGAPAFVAREIATVSSFVVDLIAVLTNLVETTPNQLRGPPAIGLLG